MPCAGAQLDAVAQTHSSPLSLVEIPSWDVVHLARLAALIDDILLAETQPPVTLQLHKKKRRGEGIKRWPQEAYDVLTDNAMSG